MRIKLNYSDVELESLLLNLEADFVERKESWNGDAPKKGREAVCAFANDLPDHNRPGVLFVGVKDDGTPAALSITDQLLFDVSGYENRRKYLTVTDHRG